MKQGKIVDKDGNTRYYKDDQQHRDNDQPAIEMVHGTKFWCQNGKYHRLAGPALIYSDGGGTYFIHDQKLTKEQHANHPEVKKYKLQQILNRLTA